MAYYIAELMKKAESAQGEDKAIIEEKCFNAILKLWSNRSLYPDDSLPFRDYDSVFKALRRIDPNFDMPFYLRKDKEILDKNKDVQNYIDMALVVDGTVKIWFEHILEQAIQSATGDSAIEYLKAILNLEDDKFLSYYVAIRELIDLEACDSDLEKINSKQIEDRIDMLKAFDQFNKDMLNSLERQLENEKSD